MTNISDRSSVGTSTRAATHARPLRGLWSMIRYQFRYTVLYPGQWGFSIVLPIVMYFMFGAFRNHAETWGDGFHSNVSAQVMFAMGVYGATLAAASIGVQVGVERAQGWGRQLALTPLRASTNLVGKVVLSMAAGILSLATLMLVGAAVGARAEGWVWVAVPCLILIGCLASSTMGIMTGYLVRSDAAYSIVGGGSAILAFLAGIWVPLDQMPEFFRASAPFTPMHGIYQLSQWPLKGGSFDFSWIANIAVWTAVPAIVAIARMREDTER